MCLKIIIVALSIAAVNGRPIGSIVPPVFPAVEEILEGPVEVSISLNNPLSPVLNTGILTLQSNSLQGRNINPEILAEPNIIPNKNDYITGSLQTNIKINQQNHFQDSQNTRTNNTKRGPQKLVQTDTGVKTNKDKPEETSLNSSNDQGQRRTTNVIDRIHSKMFTNAYVTVSNENVKANSEKQNERTETTNTESNTEPTSSNYDKTDQNSRTVSNNESASNGRSDNISANDRPTPRSKPEERIGDSGAKTDDDDRWVWGYEDMATPEVDDRANFDGSSCPNDQVKVGDKCVPRD